VAEIEIDVAAVGDEARVPERLVEAPEPVAERLLSLQRRA